jgi:hypothetical protein
LRPGPTARAAAVLVVFLALFIVVDRMSAQRSDRSAVAGGRGSPETTAATSPPTTRAPSSRPSTTAPPTTATTSTSEPAAATGSTLRSPKGVTVQVLNAVFVAGLAHQVAGMIGDAGYEVVATNTALGSYQVSRIYYTDGHKADAEAFQKRFPAFEQSFPASQAQARLSREIALHVIIGDNYRDIRPAR